MLTIDSSTLSGKRVVSMKDVFFVSVWTIQQPLGLPTNSYDLEIRRGKEEEGEGEYDGGRPRPLGD